MAYSKQNFQDGQILNAANLEKMENGIIAGQGAHNLLDNSDFRNPVAQAGIGGSHGSGKYICDRWWDRYGYGTYSLSEGVGITLSYGTNHCYCTQRINNASQYHGKAMTLAAQLSDGTIYVNSGTYLSSGTTFRIGGSNWLFDLQPNGVELVVLSGSITIVWAALYEGSYTADTLPAYQPKGYAAELAECRRYYVHCGEGNWMTGFFKVGEGLVVEIPTANNIRATYPTIIVNSPKMFTTNGWYDITYSSCAVTKCWTKLLFNPPEAANPYITNGSAYIITGIVGVSADL